MAYIQEGSTWQRRRRRRAQATLAVVVLLLLAAGGVAFGYYQGVLFQPSDDPGAVSVLPACPTTKPPLTAAGVTVNVYNTTRRDGLASTVAGDLRKRTFRIGAIANDPRNTNPRGTAVVRYGPLGRAGAKLVHAQVPKASFRADSRKGASVDLVIGEAFDALVPAPTPTPTVKATPCTTVKPTPRTTPTPTPKTTPKTTPQTTKPTSTSR